MPNPVTLEADYLVVGAGAVGMAFVDTMLTETDASFLMVDRHHMPGGHWNDAYPFVRLHQPSAYYGVNSTDLGSNRIDTSGPNEGFYELASGSEVSTYFEKVMRERFLPSGRVQFYPMCNYSGDGAFASLVSDKRYSVHVRKKTVDGTFFRTSVPSTHTRPYAVDDGVACIAPNELPKHAGAHKTYAILGGGKTAMDTGVWLMGNGAEPEAITWVVPRDSWLVNREGTQPGAEFFAQSMGGFANQLEAMRDATSVDDLFERLEKVGQMIRIDPDTWPSMFHFATISEGEVAQLHRIKNKIKGRRVAQVQSGELVLSDGTSVSMPPDTLYIDCTASAVPFSEVRKIPVFQPDKIVLQAVRAPLVSFSAALIAFVEAHVENLDEQNRLCSPIELADTPEDWLMCFAKNMINQKAWGEHPALRRWLSSIRLDPFAGMVRAAAGATPENGAIMSRIGQASIPAVMNLHKLAAEAKGGSVPA
ncbi:MAG: NAD(P)/FAD-dependent oxidoreductase [Pseudomonadota bacterium]